MKQIEQRFLSSVVKFQNKPTLTMATVLLTIKWNGKEYKIDSLTETNTVGDLKKKIEGDTGVLSDRQKLLGLKYKGL